MKGFDVLKVNSAVKSRNRFDLSRTHLTTMDFGQIVPLFSEELIPGDKFNVKADFFSRLAPLVKPTYGKFAFKTVSAFVPYFQVAEDCEAWFAGKTVWQGQTPVQRCINLSELFNFIIAYTQSGTSTSYDIKYEDSTGTMTYVTLTNRGRYYVKILNSLGYSVPQNVNLVPGGNWLTNIGNIKLSAYPILAFFKLYNDYMSQSQRYNSSTLSSILKNIQFNKTISTLYTATTGLLTASCLTSMFTSLFLNYENDYFTSAWQNPNSALNNLESLSSVNLPRPVIPSNAPSSVRSNLEDNYLRDTNGSPIVAINQRALDFLKSFDDWVRRNNYSGSRAVQQIYSRFGIKTDDYRTHYAEVLSTDSLPVQVGDVTATADSANVPLGDYAGKGIMSGSKDISYNCSDYGMLFIFGYFTVAPMMPYGFDRKVLRSSPLDYYNPEFDGLGADEISLMEVYENAYEGDGYDSDGVFGFTERYNAYRYGRDQITGDFRDLRSNGDMNCWHTGRNLSLIRSVGNLVAQSTSMNTLPQTDSEYNRIFSVTSGDVDHFYLTAHFSVDAIRPMLNLNQVANLGTGDTVVPRNGNVIS